MSQVRFHIENKNIYCQECYHATKLACDATVLFGSIVMLQHSLASEQPNATFSNVNANAFAPNPVLFPPSQIIIGGANSPAVVEIVVQSVFIGIYGECKY